jgi:release factor glutamine methyltransferase
MNNSTNYYKLPADEIYDDIKKTNQKLIETEIEEIKLVIFPNVYPSYKFRTTSFFLNNLQKLLNNKQVCDMGCGPGIIGLYALHKGAKRVIQADVNPDAVKNAQENNTLHSFDESRIKTYQSDCFDNVPADVFDIILFNTPYHCDNTEIDDPLKYAFYDPNFVSIRKFLRQSRSYSHKKTQIFIAFSNKGNTDLLETIFEQNNYNWKLWRIINSNQSYDNRIYLLTT